MLHSFIQTVVQLRKLHIINDEELVSTVEGITNFSRSLKQFDGLTWLTPTLTLTPHIWRQIYAIVYVNRYCVIQDHEAMSKQNSKSTSRCTFFALSF